MYRHAALGGVIILVGLPLNFAGTKPVRQRLARDESPGVAFFLDKIKMASFAQYEQEKQSWLRNHPEATPDEIMAAFIKIARELDL